MKRRYLLDTNILSDIIRHPSGRSARRAESETKNSIFTSIIVAAELRYGAAKKKSPTLSARVEELLGVIAVATLEPPADEIYGALRATLERTRALIGPNDLLIASHALALGMILVTDNEQEFSRVPDLVTENWLMT